MKRKINIIETAMKYHQIVLSIIVVMMILGVFSLQNMPRNEFPDFTIRKGIVIGIYPGATSMEVEEQLAVIVENYIFGYKEVNKAKTYSNSSEGQLLIFVELNADVEDADAFWSKLRHGLGELKMRLPSGVLALIGTNDFGDTAAFLITMSSEEKSYKELGKIMKKLQSNIRKVQSVSKIKRYGEQKEKIYVYVQPEKLQEYNVKPSSILASFKIQEALSYAGQLDNGELILPVHLPPRYESEQDIEEQIVYSDPDGNIIRLKDIARVERKYDKPDNYIRNNGNNALLLSLEMQQGNNIVQFGEEVEQIIAEFKKSVSDDVKINIISNQPRVVEDSISHFLIEFLIAIIAVILVTMILLPIRISLVAGATIPISILITLAIMQMAGIQLDIVSLAGLIVVLGMVVDNAIVVIDNHIEKIDEGDTPWDAAWKSAAELFVPILSATAAILASFFPLMLFLEGMAGDFVSSLPVTIGIALGISMLVAMLLVPFMCFVFIKKGLHTHDDKQKTKKSFLDKVQNTYNKGLSFTFKNPKLTITAGVLTVVVALVIFANIDQKLFPEMERNKFPIEVYLPEGASVEQTEKIIDSLETILLSDNRVTNVASFIGNGSPRFNTLYAPHMPASNYGQIIVSTISNEATIEILTDNEVKYADAFPGAHVKWRQIAMENYAAPIEVRISGDNIEDLHATADKIETILRNNDKTSWVRNDWREKRAGISINLDRNKANKLSYSKTMIAASLMTSLNGLPLTTMWEGDYPVSVILAKEDENTNDLKDLEDQYISSPITMEALPLRSIATLEPEWTEGNIVRRNGIRTITILCDMKRDQLYSQAFSEATPLIAALDLPDGVSIEYGGGNESMIENFIPMGYALGVSVVIIFFILLIQFKTIRRALLIMSTMPLSLIGAVVGLKVAGYPFGLTAFIGIIGLMGITVRNGIILIDYAMHLVTEKGYSYKEAGIAAGKRRMRPIFLTSMAAAIGVIPMVMSGSLLWGPLGTVICFGLIFGMILTLFVLPVLYWKSVGKENIQDKYAIANNK